MPLEPPRTSPSARKRGALVEIVWSSLARARLREIHAFVALDTPDAASRLSTRIVAIVEALRTQPRLGRAGSEAGVRELVIAGTPYIILCRVRGKRIRDFEGLKMPLQSFLALGSMPNRADCD